MAEKKTDKCTHPSCECTVPKGAKYCSSYCESESREFGRALTKLPDWARRHARSNGR